MNLPHNRSLWPTRTQMQPIHLRHIESRHCIELVDEVDDALQRGAYFKNVVRPVLDGSLSDYNIFTPVCRRQSVVTPHGVDGFADCPDVLGLHLSCKLETMTKSIDKIGDFQDREFKSRIMSVITLVGEISQFSSEIMESDDQRALKLSAIENLKATATELLGQVNITISDITQKTPDPDYKEYQSKVDDFQKLVGYQNALVTVLEEISKLTYLLGKGSISTERSYRQHFLMQSAERLIKLVTLKSILLKITAPKR